MRPHPSDAYNFYKSCPGCGVSRTSYVYDVLPDLITMRYLCGTVREFRGHGWGSRIRQSEQCKRNNPERRFDERDHLGPVT